MSIEQTNVVDAITHEESTGCAVLIISDHLPWNDEHLLLLQEKINRYLAFIEHGEIVDVYPQAKNRSIVIRIMCKYAPSEQVLIFLKKAQNILEKTDISVECIQFNPDT